MQSRVKWPKNDSKRQCNMLHCKRGALLGCAWCRKHLREQLEHARRVLRNFRVLSKRQNAIVMAKINLTLVKLDTAEAERLAGKLGLGQEQ